MLLLVLLLVQPLALQGAPQKGWEEVLGGLQARAQSLGVPAEQSRNQALAYSGVVNWFQRCRSQDVA